MNNRKAKGMTLAVFGIIFALYNLFVFLLCKPQTGVFWMSYAFMLVAFAAQLLSMSQAVKKLDVETVFFGIPLIQFSLFYFFAELFASTVFILFQNRLGFKAPLLIQVLLLAVFVIFAILSIGARDATKAVKDDYQEKSASIQLMAVDVDLLANAAGDGELRQRLKRLADNIRYSDPMTNDAVADVELRIRQGLNALRVACEDGNTDEAAKLCTNLDRLIVERNQKLMYSK